jgi:hypothetical protein
VMTVLGKDWRNDPGKVIERIVARLQALRGRSG